MPEDFKLGCYPALRPFLQECYLYFQWKHHKQKARSSRQSKICLMMRHWKTRWRGSISSRRSNEDLRNQKLAKQSHTLKSKPGFKGDRGSLDGASMRRSASHLRLHRSRFTAICSVDRRRHSGCSRYSGTVSSYWPHRTRTPTC